MSIARLMNVLGFVSSARARAKMPSGRHLSSAAIFASDPPWAASAVAWAAYSSAVPTRLPCT
ncbi:MAG: hypothetical protein ACKONH_11065 [Planctomycetia bacterium]